MKERIYVCHTFYQVYVTILKEFCMPKEEQGRTDIALSTMSTDFENLKEQLEAVGIFREVIILHEKRDTYFPELTKYRENKNNIFLHLINRMIFTKKYPKLEEPYMTIDFKQYKDIYIYCDSDPVGYYLNYKKIYYHAIEDGLDALKYLDAARYDNRGHFGLKAFLSSLNIIFIQNGYAKYCIDMEINDKSCLKYDCKKYIVVPRKPMEERLTAEEKEKMVRVFIPNYKEIVAQIQEGASDKDYVLFLTQPHPWSEEARKQICHDIIKDYCEGCTVMIKPHPRDTIDYEALRPDCLILKGKFPVEVLNFLEGVHFKRIISIVTTALDTLTFADEKINLGHSFWDKYEDPSNHHYNDYI